MDGSSDSGVVERGWGDAEPRPLMERVIEAVNAQLVPQLNNLTHGPLAVGAAQALAAAIEHQTSVAATTLQATVLFEGKVVGVTVQVVATP